MPKLLSNKGTAGTATTARIALWYAFSSIFVKGMAFLTTPIFTRLLSKSDFGLFSNFTSWEAILTIIVTLDFTASIARAKYDFDDTMDTYISSIVVASNIVTLISWGIVELNRGFFQDLFSMDIMYIRLMFVYILFIPAFSYLQTKHRIYRKYKFFVAFAISSALIRTGVSVLLVILMQNKFMGRVLGYVVPTTIMNIILWIVIIYRGKKVNWKSIKYASVIALPLIPHLLSGIVLGSSDRIMITQYVGAEANAMYTLAYQISLLANLLWTSMNQAYSPWLFDKLHENKHAEIRKNSKLYLGLFAVLIIGVLFITPELILVLGGKRYYEAIYVMPPVIMGCVFQFVYGMYVNLEIYSKKTVMISAGTMAAALLNIGLNIIFIPKFGYIAAAYTTLVGYAALFVFHLCIVRFKFKELISVYDLKFNFMIILILFVCSGLSLMLYQIHVIRYVIGAIYGFLLIFFAFRYRNKILSLLGVKRANEV